MSFKFRVYLADGRSSTTTSRPSRTGSPATRFYIDGRAKYRITKVDSNEDLEGSDYAGIWEVEPVETTARTEG